MSEKKSILKTCSSCGQQKPLASFLQLSGPERGTYGHVCASCRGSQAQQKIEIEEGSRTSTGFKIDAKAKVQADTDKKTQFDTVEEEYYEERDKEFRDQTRQVQRKDFKAKEEKSHRESFLNKSQYREQSKGPTDKALSQEKSDRVFEQEQRIDFNAPFIDTYISGKEKYKGTPFKNFRAWLGKAEQTPQQQAQKTTNKVQEKNLAKKIEENWGDKSKGPTRKR